MKLNRISVPCIVNNLPAKPISVPGGPVKNLNRSKLIENIPSSLQVKNASTVSDRYKSSSNNFNDNRKTQKSSNHTLNATLVKKKNNRKKNKSNVIGRPISETHSNFEITSCKELEKTNLLIDQSYKNNKGNFKKTVCTVKGSHTNGFITDGSIKNRKSMNNNNIVKTTKTESMTNQSATKTPKLNENNSTVNGGIINNVNLKEKKEGSNNWKKMLSMMPDLATKNKNVSPNNLIQNNTRPDNIWFEGVDKNLIEQSRKRPHDNDKDHPAPKRPLVKEHAYTGLTRLLAIDCEMVGIGPRGEESMLARVSIVNRYGHCVYDKYVKPIQEVTDYRTAVSGIRPNDIINGEEFAFVREEVKTMLNGRVVIGHAITNDLKALYIAHRRQMIRDTSTYKTFVDMNNGRTPSLRNLTDALLGVKIQDGEHDSITDAQATMRLYTLHRKQWEKELKLCKRDKK